ncbi:MAG: DUF3575 domain-containing protein [Crocinitomicaceae bacterium]|nr:DUF3575 domain-containing protein [Crocinitomicaceae bacterium]
MKSILTSIALFSLCTITFGQREIIVIDKESRKKSRAPREIKTNSSTSAIKFSPLQMLAGEINFGYERMINQKSSFEIELGPTISEIGFGSVDNHYFNTTPYAQYDGKLGFFGSVAYRYYPLDETEALNRFYISPVLKYKIMNRVANDPSGNLSNQNASETNFNFTFNMGYQLWVSKSFAFDFFAGLGIGMQDVKRYQIGSEFNGTDYNYFWQEDFSNGSRYVATVGIKVSIGMED